MLAKQGPSPIKTETGLAGVSFEVRIQTAISAGGTGDTAQNYFGSEPIGDLAHPG